MLKNNKYLKVYRNIFDNFESDFYLPSYYESIELNRASGFFSLSSLIFSIDGIIKLTKKNGKIKIICNPFLSDDDIELIQKGMENSNKIALQKIIYQIENESLSLNEQLKLDIICNLISCGSIEIKIAFMKSGIYHEKFGIFVDEEYNMVYFNGSSNETLNGKLYNGESILTYTSWEDNNNILSEYNYFKSLWNNQIEKITVLDFDELLKLNLFKKYKKSDDLNEAINKYISSTKTTKKKLHDYQELAINEFIANDYSHLYEMATGTGKTFTAIKTIEKVFLDKGNVFTIVCVPQIDLQAQWLSAFEEAGFKNVYLFGGLVDSKKTDKNLSEAKISYFTGDEGIICISVYDTFFNKIYTELNNIDNLFLVFDEVHNLTPQNINRMPTNVKYKLGLSATVERYSDLETKLILDYFVKENCKPYYYGLESAIENKYLSRYEYHPIFVNLDFEDFIKYKNKSKSIATLYNLKEEDRDYERINRLKNERSLIVKQSRSKIEKLKELIYTNTPNIFKNSVVYCGQGKDEDDDSIIDRVTKILSFEGNLSVSQFTSKTVDRVRVLYEFENDYFDTLVAIKCFDEGVDVPKLDKIYIMSSDSSLRQTIQRRGRVLRKCSERGKEKAYIYDMVVLPPSSVDYGPGVKPLVLNEFRRCREYVRLATNKIQVEEILDDYLDKYGIGEEEVEYEF